MRLLRPLFRSNAAFSALSRGFRGISTVVPRPVAGRAADRLLGRHGVAISDALKLTGPRLGKVPSDCEVIRDDFAAVDGAFRTLMAGQPTPSAELNALFARTCGGPGQRRVDGELQLSKFTYRENQLWRGTHPLPASVLAAPRGPKTAAIATCAPDTLGFDAADYARMLWDSGATDVLSVTPLEFWPRQEATFGDITVRRTATRMEPLPAMEPSELQALTQPWQADLWLDTLSAPGACTVKEPLFIATYELHRGAEKARTLTVSQFNRWPDLGVVHGKTLASLIRHVRSERGAGPLVVNCLAGVGRTGTYLCADGAAQRLALAPHSGRYNSALWEMFRLRLQRPHMVQREVQLFGVLAALRHL